jgi:hypothetical protein
MVITSNHITKPRHLDCSPKVLLTICAVTFNLTCTGKMWKIIKWKVCQLSPLSLTLFRNALYQ